MIRRFLCNLTTTKLKVNYWGLLGISRDIIIIPLGEQNISQPNSAAFCFIFISNQTEKLYQRRVALVASWCLISDRNIHIAYLILHPIMVSGDLEIQPNLIETIWKWELKFKVLKWFQHDCFQQLERKGEF